MQCHRCQKWGHATSNFHVKPKCLKCAGNHLSNKCTTDTNAPLTCANCGNNHSANSIKYPASIQRLEWINKNKNMTATRGALQHRLHFQRQQPTRQIDNNKMNFPSLNENKSRMRRRSQELNRDDRAHYNLTYKEILVNSSNHSRQHSSQNN